MNQHWYLPYILPCRFVDMCGKRRKCITGENLVSVLPGYLFPLKTVDGKLKG